VKVFFWLCLVCLVIWAIGHDKSSSSESAPVSTHETSSSTAESEEAEPDPSPSFAGYPCTIDCSGHKAGYEWAERNSIDDEDDCDAAAERSDSPSFGEGCKAYVNGESPDESDDDEN
jgi:hypothetical protein